MEPDLNQLPSPTPPSPTNDPLPPPPGFSARRSHSAGNTPAAAAAPVEAPRRKRGRPRKYDPPNRTPSSSRSASPSASYSISWRNSPALGNEGQGITTHVIAVIAGEDINQRLTMFQEQTARNTIVFFATGSISNATLHQPGSGGNTTFEGLFQIISLSGSYVRNDTGGVTGGLSVSLSNTEGQVFGGAVGGPLVAARPVQVIAGTFLGDRKRDGGSSSRLPSPSTANVGIASPEGPARGGNGSTVD